MALTTMRAATEQRLNDIWYGDDPPPMWLRGLVPAYQLGNRVDRWWQTRHRPQDLASACIIVVGNITVGGSGKSPLVIRLCRLLREAGLEPGVISRGYGSRAKGLRLVGPASEPEVVGDEPLMIAQETEVPVVVSPDRCAAARALVKRGHRVIVSDDGLQHYRLPRSIEICVIDGSRGFGNGRLLPAGPLRELPERLRSVDHIVVNGEARCLPDGLETVPMTLAAGLLRPLEGGQSWRLSQFTGCRVNAVAGIAHPQRFFDLLRHARITVNEYPFPDHYAYTPRDFERMPADLPILMTEKDAVKCRKLGISNAWFLTVDAVLPAGWEAGLVRQVRACLERPGQRPEQLPGQRPGQRP